VLAAAERAEHIILLSGDGDFDLLLERIKRYSNVTTEVYSVATLTAKSLIDSADTFHPIDENFLL
jgi:uncharacterized LabA/DUF88 family protein